MKFSCAAVLAIGSLARRGDGFVLVPAATSRSGSVNDGSSSSSSSSFASFTSAPVRGRVPATTATTSATTTGATTTRMEMVGGMANDEDFLDALRPGKKRGSSDDQDDEDEVSVGSESSRFKELMKAAKMAGGQQHHIPRPIENPFLNPPPPPVIQQQQQSLPFVAAIGGDPSTLSVEEQARMFREMMARSQQQQQQQEQQQPSQQLGAMLPPPPPRVSKTDRAGRPVGRNRDADSIANTADLYFAQLKRDSSVRTIARLRGENDVAEQVFADEGIKQLDELLQKNPYLQGQRDDDMRQIENIPTDVLAQYFESSSVREGDLAKSGISYKEKLMQRRQKEASTTNMATPPAPQLATPVSEPTVVVAPQPVVDAVPPSPPQELDPVVVVQAPSWVEQLVDGFSPAPSQPEPVVATALSTPAVTATQAVGAAVASANPEEIRQKIRTFMGLVLKHRGGPGFGKGRLKGPDIDRYEGLLEEITILLREEATVAQPVDSPLMSTAAPTPVIASNSAAVLPPTPMAPTSFSAATPSVAVGSIDSTIACIEGAITMYKNSPPQLQPSVLGVLQAALVSAVATCNAVLSAQPPPPGVPGSPDGRIDGMIACVEGAVTLYKNSPPQLRESVLVALRVALMSAVETCNTVVTGGSVPQQTTAVRSSVAMTTAATTMTPPQVTVMPLTPPSTVESTVFSTPSPPVQRMDPNSRALDEIYESVKAAHGEGSLGLRGDLTQAEATKLADQLVDMRNLLMQELEAGIPDPDPVDASVSDDSSASRYQEMLAKARAEKAAA